MNNLRAYRVKKLMTQKDLAKASGVSLVTISFIENGLSEPTYETKQKLVRKGLKMEGESDVNKVFPPKKKVKAIKRK